MIHITIFFMKKMFIQIIIQIIIHFIIHIIIQDIIIQDIIHHPHIHILDIIPDIIPENMLKKIIFQIIKTNLIQKNFWEENRIYEFMNILYHYYEKILQLIHQNLSMIYAFHNI